MQVAPCLAEANARQSQISVRFDEVALGFVNPGAESDELLAEARKLGLAPILACSIVDIGLSPSDFPE